jgi:hypothetical protein
MPSFSYQMPLRVGVHHESLSGVNVKNGNHKTKQKKTKEFLTLKAIWQLKLNDGGSFIRHRRDV